MKKILKISLIVTIVLVVLCFVAGFFYRGIIEHNRVKNLDLDGDTIVITEDEYINYVDELCINTYKYIGKNIIIDGFFDSEEYEGVMYNYIGREIKIEEIEGHEHSEECEHSHFIGLEFVYDGELPEIGSFIQVTGTLGIITEDDEEFLVLEDCTIHTDIRESAETAK